MVVIKSKYLLDFRSHNGRRYNMIFSYDPEKEEFRGSKPNYAENWKKDDPIPMEIVEELTESEMKKLLKFMKGCE